MAYIQVEASVRTHRKFLQAGPAASWLWLCGVGYCQDGLTDGFIPFEALQYLGVKAPDRLKTKLVETGLWVQVAGGWRIHDYLRHNKSAADIQRIKTTRAAGGYKGGRPNLSDNLQGLPSTEPSVKPSLVETSRAVDDVVAVAVVESKETAEFPGDIWWSDLLADYPQNRVTNNHLANQAFVNALMRAKDGPHAAWARMKRNLENQKRGHEWRVKGMVPSLQKWLESGAWEQVHDETPASVLVTEKTAKTLEAAAAVKRFTR